MGYAYGLLLVVHIASIAVALGALVAAPIVLSAVRREGPDGVAGLVRAQRRLGDAVVAPAATLTLLTGVALATIAGFWGELWVSLPLSLLVFVLALHGAYVSPTQRRLEALAAELAAPTESEDPVPSSAYNGVARRLAAASYASAAAIVLAMALMVLKPS